MTRHRLMALCLMACVPVGLVRAADASDWKQILQERIPLYGHRNWIVVADSAYPAQSRPGIETIVVHADQLSVLQTVLTDLSHSRHVRPIVHTDRELSFLTDEAAPGVAAYRTQLDTLLGPAKPLQELHTDIIGELDSAAQTFRVLILKTDMTIPYTSVFLQLDCAYWSAESERKLRVEMGKTQ